MQLTNVLPLLVPEVFMKRKLIPFIIITTLILLISTIMINDSQKNGDTSVQIVKNPHIGFPCNYDHTCRGELVCNTSINVCQKLDQNRSNTILETVSSNPEAIYIAQQ